MANVFIQPEFDLFESMEATLDADEAGVASAKVTYYAKDAMQALALLKTGETCPLVSNGMMASARFLHGSAKTIGAGEVWQVELFWRGMSVNATLDEAAIPSYTPTSQTAPIDTHPTFESFAGTPDSPLNEAVFDEQGQFTGFRLYSSDGVTKNPKAGIKNYYQASLKVGEHRVIDQEKLGESDWLMVGKIDDPDIEDLITINLRIPDMEDQTRDYLLNSVVLEDLGQGYASLDREWLMSGPFGWDTDIYDYSDTGDGTSTTL